MENLQIGTLQGRGGQGRGGQQESMEITMKFLTRLRENEATLMISCFLRVTHAFAFIVGSEMHDNPCL